MFLLHSLVFHTKNETFCSTYQSKELQINEKMKVAQVNSNSSVTIQGVKKQKKYDTDVVMIQYCRVIVPKEQQCIIALEVKTEQNTTATLNDIVNVMVVDKGEGSNQNP